MPPTLHRYSEEFDDERPSRTIHKPRFTVDNRGKAGYRKPPRPKDYSFTRRPRPNRTMKERTCIICHEGFTAARRDALYCSERCRQAAKLERRVMTGFEGLRPAYADALRQMERTAPKAAECVKHLRRQYDAPAAEAAISAAVNFARASRR